MGRYNELLKFIGCGSAFNVRYVIKHKGVEYFENVFMKKFDNTTIIGLLLTLIIIFLFQGEIILNNLFHIVLIAVAISIFGLQSGDTLVTVVGVLVEVSVMLTLVKITNRTSGWF